MACRLPGQLTVFIALVRLIFVILLLFFQLQQPECCHGILQPSLRCSMISSILGRDGCLSQQLGFLIPRVNYISLFPFRLMQ